MTNIYKILILLFLVVNVYSSDLQDGFKEYTNKQYKKAAIFFEKAAINGSSKAEFLLASLYDTGKGVNQNNKKALYWYEKAAINGNVNAQFLLAMKYEKGEGVKKDLKKAFLPLSGIS